MNPQEIHDLIKILFPAITGAGGIGSFIILCIFIAIRLKLIHVYIGKNGKTHLSKDELENECLKRHTPIDQAISKMTQMQMSIDGSLIDIHAELRAGNNQFGRIEERIERIEKALFNEKFHMVGG